MRRMLFITLGTLAFGYLAILGLLFSMQRQMLFPRPEKGRPFEYPQASIVTIPATVECPYEGKALYLKAPPGGRTLVHFHGNGEQLADVTDIAQGRGMGFFAPEYPGYGFLLTARSLARRALRRRRSRLAAPDERAMLETNDSNVTTTNAAFDGRSVAFSKCRSSDTPGPKFRPTLNRSSLLLSKNPH
ncbi:MAG: hypothetical protein K1X64_23175 [Myxococcaceae bacterium]|nr:hypothetical protein [Myxococcaceae bacterium]